MLLKTLNLPFRKKCGKRRKCWLPASSLFPTMLSICVFLRGSRSCCYVVRITQHSTSCWYIFGDINSCQTLKLLPNNKVFGLTKLKASADDKFHVAKMMISLFDRVENFVVYHHFSPFLSMFS